MYFKELELGFWTPCLNKQLDSDRLERCWELLAGGFPQPRAIPDRDLGSCMTLSKLFYPILSPVFPYENGINNYYHIYCAWLLWKLMEALKIWNMKDTVFYPKALNEWCLQTELPLRVWSFRMRYFRDKFYRWNSS
jgi:hypothetical protein